MYKVIFIDDEPWVLKGLEGIIDWNAKGFEVTAICRDGKQGLEKIKELRPDVVFTDLRMPNMGGMKLIRQLHEEGILAKIVILSAYSDFEVAREAISKRVFDYLLKPLDQNVVEGLVNRLLRELAEKPMDQAIYKKKSLTKEQELELRKAAIYPGWYLVAAEKEIAKENIQQQLDRWGDGSNKYSTKRIALEEVSDAILLFAGGKEMTWDGMIMEGMGVSMRHNDFDDWEEMVHEAELSLWGQFYYAPNHMVAEIQYYLGKHYTENIPLEALADRFHLSKTYLCEIFLKHTGVTINQFVKNIRMKRALYLLRTTDLLIKEIAEQIGYEDSSYFCRVFRRTQAVSPDVYRNTN